MQMDVEDVEMTSKEARVITYIAVDTNILLDDLQTVHALFRILSLPSLQSTAQLLIPQTVLYEIDNHHKLGKPHIRHQSREANRLLNRLIKSKQLDQRVPLRVQKVSEIQRADLSRPDDRILDCCLYFASQCDQIWLWTKDQVFQTIARSNDIHVLESTQLPTVVRSLGIDEVAGVKEQVKDLSSSRLLPEDDIEDSEMEVDEDLYFDLPALVADIEKHGTVLAPAADGTRSLLSDYLSRYSPSVVDMPSWSVPENNENPQSSASSAHSSSTCLDRSPIKTSPKLSERNVHARLENALTPLIVHLSVETPQPDLFLTPLLDKLLELDSALYPNYGIRSPVTGERQTLLIATDGMRTLVKYCERDVYDKSRRPRLNEVAEAIEAVGKFGDLLGLALVHSSCSELAVWVRTH